LTRRCARRGELPRASNQPVIQAWRTDRTAAGIRYRIEETHPAVKDVIDQAGPLLPALRAMLRVLEETVPVQRIWLDTTEAQETPLNAFAGEAPEAVREVLTEVFQGMINRGMDPASARARLL